MGRPNRSERQHGYFHVMNRGVDHGRTFFDDADRVDFGRVLGDVAAEIGVEVHAYCVMSNHFHLVVNCPTGGLSTFMQRLVALHTRHVNDRHGRDGPLYRGRFRSLPITDDPYLLAAVRYVHRNPAPTDDRAVDRYRWSSHRHYLGHRRVPGWLRTDLVLGALGGVEGYRSFVAGSGGLDRRVAIELAVEEHEHRLERTAKGLPRTVALALAHDGTWPVTALSELGVEFANDRQRRKATSRASRTARCDDVLSMIADRAARLAA